MTALLRPWERGYWDRGLTLHLSTTERISYLPKYTPCLGSPENYHATD